MLNEKEKEILRTNLHTSVKDWFFKKDQEGISYKKIAEQIQARKKIEKKIPSWFENENLLFPPSLSLEQSSSEITALYKASKLPKGKKFIDLTGGMGIDISFLSQNFEQLVYCEQNETLSQLSKYNFEVLGLKNIETFTGNSVLFLENNHVKYDCIFLDPARRKADKKVFRLEDCTPNLLEIQEMLWEKTSKIWVKLSPMIDLFLLKKRLPFLKNIFVISVQNECKEILIELEKNYSGNTYITASNFHNDSWSEYLSESTKWETKCMLLEPQNEEKKYIYLPNTSIMKAGLADIYCQEQNLVKMSTHTHLYFGNQMLDQFQGRIFEIKQEFTSKKDLQKAFKNKPCEIICKNAKEKAEFYFKKFKLKKGSNKDFLIIGTHQNNKVSFFETLRIQ
ncbi:MAG: RsmD family RNA methyltransferase [Flavobacteriales bacterium]|jgi:hypothetical protein|nr:RsmD family RNA methyltransferase [Flavobacteriales bacterium]